MPTRSTEWIWALLAGLLLAMASGAAQGAEAAQREPTGPDAQAWLAEGRFFWNVYGKEPEYLAAAERLPPEEAALRKRLGGRAWVPLDLSAGADRPRLTVVLQSHSDTGDLFRATDLLVKTKLNLLDLTFGSGVTGQKLLRLEKSTVRSLALPAKSLRDAEVAKLLGRPGALPGLQHLELFVPPPEPGAGEGGLTPAVLEAVLAHPGLRSLRLYGEGVDDRWATPAAAGQRLVGLGLYRPRITDRGLEALCKPGRLTHLAIAYPQRLTDKGLQALSHLPKLKELHLMGASPWAQVPLKTDPTDWRVSDATLAVLRDLPALEVLVVDPDIVSEAGFKSLAAMKRLHTVVLVHSDEMRDEVRQGFKAWAAADPARRLHLLKGRILGGWVEDLAGLWVMVPNELRFLN